MAHRSTTRNARGQTLAETALVLPLFVMVITGLISLGLGLFYQQQVNTAAREAARFAAIHSATSDCPTSSWKPVNVGMLPEGMQLNPDCDPPPHWPRMTEHARRLTFGLNPSQVFIRACWSGYTDYANPSSYDAGPAASDGNENDWRECTIAGRYPLTETSDISCPPPATAPTDDTASNLASSTGRTANRVSVYACYVWSPPLAGFLLLPETVTLRAAISQPLQHQR